MSAIRKSVSIKLDWTGSIISVCTCSIGEGKLNARNWFYIIFRWSECILIFLWKLNSQQQTCSLIALKLYVGTLAPPEWSNAHMTININYLYFPNMHWYRYIHPVLSRVCVVMFRMVIVMWLMQVDQSV